MGVDRLLKSWALACGVAVTGLSASAQELPGAVFGADAGGIENLAPTSTSRQLPAKNVLNLPNLSSPIHVQMAKIGGGNPAEFAGSTLIVISPDSRSARYAADSRGVVKFQAKQVGLHALVTTGPYGHAAFPIIVRTTSVDEEVFAASGSQPTITLPIFTLLPGEASRALRSFVPPRKFAATDLDASLVASGELMPTRDFQVDLSEAGRLEGQVMTLLRQDLIGQSLAGNNLLLFKNGELQARSISDSMGRFAFENLKPGSYGIICAGPGGYAAFGFEAMMPSMSASIGNRKQFVSTLAQTAPPSSPGGLLPVVPIPSPFTSAIPESFQDEDEEPMLADAAFSPVAGGGGGGPGGGGSGAGGIGDAGGLLGLAGLGAALAAAASRSNNDRVIVIPTPDPATDPMP